MDHVKTNGRRLTAKEFALKYGIYIGFVVIFVIFSVVSKNFLTRANFMNILDQYAYFVVCAMGMFFVVMVGGVDLSCGGMIAFSSVVGALVMLRTRNAALGCLVILAICVLGGTINSLSV